MRRYWLGGLIVPMMLGVGSVYAENPIRILNVDTGAVWVFTSTGVVAEDDLRTVTTISTAAVVTPSIGAISVDGKSILAGDYVPQRPEFVVTLTPASGADIGAYSLAIVTVGTGSVIASTANTLGSGVTQAVTVTFRPGADLQSGNRYYVRVNAQGTNGGSVTENSVEFLREDGFKFDQVINSPNPFNPTQESTYIEAQLTKETEIVASIYSLSGELIWKQTQTGTPGYWSIPWNGRNMFGEVVPNGAYIAILVAKSGSERRTAKLKVGVLR